MNPTNTTHTISKFIKTRPPNKLSLVSWIQESNLIHKRKQKKKFKQKIQDYFKINKMTYNLRDQESFLQPQEVNLQQKSSNTLENIKSRSIISGYPRRQAIPRKKKERTASASLAMWPISASHASRLRGWGLPEARSPIFLQAC